MTLIADLLLLGEWRYVTQEAKIRASIIAGLSENPDVSLRAEEAVGALKVLEDALQEEINQVIAQFATRFYRISHEEGTRDTLPEMSQSNN